MTEKEVLRFHFGAIMAELTLWASVQSALHNRVQLLFGKVRQ